MKKKEECYSVSSQLVWGMFEFVMVILIVSIRNWAKIKIKIPFIMFNDPSQFQFIHEIPLLIFEGVTAKTTPKACNASVEILHLPCK